MHPAHPEQLKQQSLLLPLLSLAFTRMGKLSGAKQSKGGGGEGGEATCPGGPVRHGTAPPEVASSARCFTQDTVSLEGKRPARPVATSLTLPGPGEEARRLRSPIPTPGSPAHLQGTPCALPGRAACSGTWRKGAPKPLVVNPSGDPSPPCGKRRARAPSRQGAGISLPSSATWESLSPSPPALLVSAC